MNGKALSLPEALPTVLARTLPEFRAVIALERLSGGASQETYKLKIDTTGGARQLALRRETGGQPMARTSGQVGLRVEARLIKAAHAAGVPVPEILGEFEPGDGLGEGFVMTWIDGESLGARLVRSPELAAVRPRLAFECGQVLARIHAIDPTTSGLSSVLEVRPPVAFVNATWQHYQALQSPQPMIDFTARWLLANLPPARSPRLVHGDFRNGNLMVTPRGVVAVLDWEIAHLGDPLRDLGWLCTNLWRFGNSALPVGGFGEYADLLAGYAAESGQPIDLAELKFWEVFGSFWWAVGCLKMAEHFRLGPDQTVERPGIGRRSSECQVDCVNLLIPGAVTRVVPNAAHRDDALPRLDELVSSVRDYLRADVMAATTGRTSFLGRVAANSLDIVLRDMATGEQARDAEHERLRRLFNSDAALNTLRWRLVDGLRTGQLAIEQPELTIHLRETVVNEALIDQPTYSGCVTALRNAGYA